jgi:tetratricopeptide (TPR) repeat protein
MIRLVMIAALTLASAGLPANAQSEGYRLDESGQWVRTSAPDPDSDEAFMAEMQTLIAEGHPSPAIVRLGQWIRKYKKTDNPYLARAYLLRGDARAAAGSEYRALYDYEHLIRNFPSAPEFVTAIKRELEIAIAYVHGMRRRAFGFRISSARATGEKLLLLVEERMPGSQLAETANIELADYYFREGNLEMADEVYKQFIRSYGQSRMRQHAMLYRVYASIGQFKGPRYDSTMLTDAKLLIEDFVDEYPFEAERKGMDGYLAGIEESKAAQQLVKARWYLRRGDQPSARFMFRRIVREHPTTVSGRVARDELEKRGWLLEPSTPEEPEEEPKAPRQIDVDRSTG